MPCGNSGTARDSSKELSLAIVLSGKQCRMGATDDEQAWISQSRNGDPAAFESLVRAHQRTTGIGKGTMLPAGGGAVAQMPGWQLLFLLASERFGGLLRTTDRDTKSG
jgi:hypothetical protein